MEEHSRKINREKIEPNLYKKKYQFFGKARTNSTDSYVVDINDLSNTKINLQKKSSKKNVKTNSTRKPVILRISRKSSNKKKKDNPLKLKSLKIIIRDLRKENLVQFLKNNSISLGSKSAKILDFKPELINYTTIVSKVKSDKIKADKKSNTSNLKKSAVNSSNPNVSETIPKLKLNTKKIYEKDKPKELKSPVVASKIEPTLVKPNISSVKFGKKKEQTAEKSKSKKHKDTKQVQHIKKKITSKVIDSIEENWENQPLISRKNVALDTKLFKKFKCKHVKLLLPKIDKVLNMKNGQTTTSITKIKEPPLKDKPDKYKLKIKIKPTSEKSLNKFSKTKTNLRAELKEINSNIEKTVDKSTKNKAKSSSKLIANDTNTNNSNLYQKVEQQKSQSTKLKFIDSKINNQKIKKSTPKNKKFSKSKMENTSADLQKNTEINRVNKQEVEPNHSKESLLIPMSSKRKKTVINLSVEIQKNDNICSKNKKTNTKNSAAPAVSENLSDQKESLLIPMKSKKKVKKKETLQEKLPEENGNLLIPMKVKKKQIKGSPSKIENKLEEIINKADSLLIPMKSKRKVINLKPKANTSIKSIKKKVKKIYPVKDKNKKVVQNFKKRLRSATVHKPEEKKVVPPKTDKKKKEKKDAFWSPFEYVEVKSIKAPSTLIEEVFPLPIPTPKIIPIPIQAPIDDLPQITSVESHAIIEPTPNIMVNVQPLEVIEPVLPPVAQKIQQTSGKRKIKYPTNRDIKRVRFCDTITVLNSNELKKKKNKNKSDIPKIKIKSSDGNLQIQSVWGNADLIEPENSNPDLVLPQLEYFEPVADNETKATKSKLRRRPELPEWDIPVIVEKRLRTSKKINYSDDNSSFLDEILESQILDEPIKQLDNISKEVIDEVISPATDQISKEIQEIKKTNEEQEKEEKEKEEPNIEKVVQDCAVSSSSSNDQYSNSSPKPIKLKLKLKKSKKKDEFSKLEENNEKKKERKSKKSNKKDKADKNKKVKDEEEKNKEDKKDDEINKEITTKIEMDFHNKKDKKSSNKKSKENSNKKDKEINKSLLNELKTSADDKKHKTSDIKSKVVEPLPKLKIANINKNGEAKLVVEHISPESEASKHNKEKKGRPKTKAELKDDTTRPPPKKRGPKPKIKIPFDNICNSGEKDSTNNPSQIVKSDTVKTLVVKDKPPISSISSILEKKEKPLLPPPKPKSPPPPPKPKEPKLVTAETVAEFFAANIKKLSELNKNCNWGGIYEHAAYHFFDTTVNYYRHYLFNFWKNNTNNVQKVLISKLRPDQLDLNVNVENLFDAVGNEEDSNSAYGRGIRLERSIKPVKVAPQKIETKVPLTSPTPCSTNTNNQISAAPVHDVHKKILDDENNSPKITFQNSPLNLADSKQNEKDTNSSNSVLQVPEINKFSSPLTNFYNSAPSLLAGETLNKNEETNKDASIVVPQYVKSSPQTIIPTLTAIPVSKTTPFETKTNQKATEGLKFVVTNVEHIQKDTLQNYTYGKHLENISKYENQKIDVQKSNYTSNNDYQRIVSDSQKLDVQKTTASSTYTTSENVQKNNYSTNIDYQRTTISSTKTNVPKSNYSTTNVNFQRNISTPKVASPTPSYNTSQQQTNLEPPHPKITSPAPIYNISQQRNLEVSVSQITSPAPSYHISQQANLETSRSRITSPAPTYNIQSQQMNLDSSRSRITSPAPTYNIQQQQNLDPTRSTLTSPVPHYNISQQKSSETVRTETKPYTTDQTRNVTSPFPLQKSAPNIKTTSVDSYSTSNYSNSGTSSDISTERRNTNDPANRNYFSYTTTNHTQALPLESNIQAKLSKSLQSPHLEVARKTNFPYDMNKSYSHLSRSATPDNRNLTNPSPAPKTQEKEKELQKQDQRTQQSLQTTSHNFDTQNQIRINEKAKSTATPTTTQQNYSSNPSTSTSERTLTHTDFQQSYILNNYYTTSYFRTLESSLLGTPNLLLQPGVTTSNEVANLFPAEELNQHYQQQTQPNQLYSNVDNYMINSSDTQSSILLPNEAMMQSDTNQSFAMSDNYSPTLLTLNSAATQEYQQQQAQEANAYTQWEKQQAQQSSKATADKSQNPPVEKKRRLTQGRYDETAKNVMTLHLDHSKLFSEDLKFAKNYSQYLKEQIRMKYPYCHPLIGNTRLNKLGSAKVYVHCMDKDCLRFNCTLQSNMVDAVGLTPVEIKVYGDLCPEKQKQVCRIQMAEAERMLVE